MIKIIRDAAILLLIFTAVFFVLGCAERSTELLTENYKTMSNENILRYYYKLNDEIESQEKQSTPQFSIGIGSFGYGIGGGAAVDTGKSGHTAKDLRARRVDVKLELKRRGLNP